MDKHDLIELLLKAGVMNNCSTYEAGRLKTAVFDVDEYHYDYRHAIIKYMKQRGMGIKSHGCCFSDKLVVRHGAPTKEVDIDKFINSYRKLPYIDGAYIYGTCSTIIITSVILTVCIIAKYFI